MHRVLSAAVVTASLLLAAATPLWVGAAEVNEESESPRSPDCVYVVTEYDVID